LHYVKRSLTDLLYLYVTIYYLFSDSFTYYSFIFSIPPNYSAKSLTESIFKDFSKSPKITVLAIYSYDNVLLCNLLFSWLTDVTLTGSATYY